MSLYRLLESIKNFNLYKKYLFFSHNSIVSLLFLVAFQICYSIAPVFLGLAIASSKTQALTYMVLIYILLNYVPYPLSAVSYIYQSRWIAKSREKIAIYVLEKFSKKYNALLIKAEYDKSLAIASNNSQTIVVDYIAFFYNFVSSFTSSTLTLIFLAIFVNPTLIIYYCISILICALIIVKSKHTLSILTKKQESSLNLALTDLGKILPSVIMDQKPFTTQINRRMREKWQKYFKHTNNTTQTFQLISNIQSLVIWLPISFGVIILLASKPLSSNYILIGYIPRLIELMLDISGFVMQILNFGRYTARIQWLDNELKKKCNNDHHLRVNKEKIFIRIMGKEDLLIKSTKDLRFFIKNCNNQNGRVTITGENGAGKTSLLFAVKHQFPEKSLLILANHKQKLLPASKSVGQHSMIELLSAIKWAEKRNGFILLLDEWNANLDKINEKIINEKLNLLTKTGLIIETLHH